MSGMPASALAAATRAFVSVLLLLARRYELYLAVNRDSSQQDLLKAYRKVVLKVHPDKGGKKEDAQKLQAAKAEWGLVRKRPANVGGRPSAGPDGGVVVAFRQRKEYRVHETVVLLTYHGVADLKQWHRFVSFVRSSLEKWEVRKWGATLEACETDGLHTHLVLQFAKKVDRTARSFTFEGLTPKVRPGDTTPKFH